MRLDGAGSSVLAPLTDPLLVGLDGVAASAHALQVCVFIASASRGGHAVIDRAGGAGAAAVAELALTVVAGEDSAPGGLPFGWKRASPPSLAHGKPRASRRFWGTWCLGLAVVSAAGSSLTCGFWSEE